MRISLMIWSSDEHARAGARLQDVGDRPVLRVPIPGRAASCGSSISISISISVSVSICISISTSVSISISISIGISININMIAIITTWAALPV